MKIWEWYSREWSKVKMIMVGLLHAVCVHVWRRSRAVSKRSASTGKSRSAKKIAKSSASKARYRSTGSKARRASKARSSTPRARSASSKTTSVRRSAKARSVSAAKLTGRSTSAKARAAGSNKLAKTKSGVRSRSSSAAGRSQSRGRMASTEKATKQKKRFNCYTAYLKAQLANRKVTKVSTRDVAVTSLRWHLCVTAFLTACRVITGLLRDCWSDVMSAFNCFKTAETMSWHASILAFFSFTLPTWRDKVEHLYTVYLTICLNKRQYSVDS